MKKAIKRTIIGLSLGFAISALANLITLQRIELVNVFVGSLLGLLFYHLFKLDSF